MNTMMNMVTSQPPVKPAEVKKTAPLKDTAQNTENTAKDQDTEFSDILNQASQDTNDAPQQQENTVPEESLEAPTDDTAQNPLIALIQIHTMPVIAVTAELGAAAKGESDLSDAAAIPVSTVVSGSVETKAQTMNAVNVAIQNPDFSKMLQGANSKQEVPPQQGVQSEILPQQNNVQAANANLLALLAGKSAQSAAAITVAAQNAGELGQEKLAEEPKVAEVVSQGKNGTAKNNTVLTAAPPIIKAGNADTLATNASTANVSTANVLVEEQPNVDGVRQMKSRDQVEVKVQDAASPLMKTTADATPNLDTAAPKADASSQTSQFATSPLQVKTDGGGAVQTSAVHTPRQADPHDIRGQIVEQARMIKTTEDTQMIIKLKPEHLGELTLKVTVEKGAVSATFHSDNAQVRTMLETTLIQLKQELANQGIKVDNVGVYAGLGQFMSDGQARNGQEQQNTRFKNRKIDLAEFEDEVEKVSGVSENTATQDGGVDYRI